MAALRSTLPGIVMARAADAAAQRHAVRSSTRATTPGMAADALDEPPRTRDPSRAARSGLDARRDLRRQHVVRVEAGIDPDERDEAADEERGADQQDDGQRDFGDDERAPQHAGGRRRSRRAAVFQGVREIGPGQLKGRTRCRTGSR